MTIRPGIIACRPYIPAGKRNGARCPFHLPEHGAAPVIRGEMDDQLQRIPVKKEDRGIPRFVQ